MIKGGSLSKYSKTLYYKHAESLILYKLVFFYQLTIASIQIVVMIYVNEQITLIELVKEMV